MKTIVSSMRRLAYLTASRLDNKVAKQNDVIILCYHSVADDNWRFSESFPTLKTQIDYLLTIREPLSLADLELFLNGKKPITTPSFIITFDDGYENILQTVKYFQKKQIRPALFVLSHPEKANRAELGNDLPLLSDSQIKTLQKAGWIIGAHGATHADFMNINTTVLKNEIQDAKQLLEKKLGFPVSYFSYPKGVYSNSIINTVKKSGYSMAVSMDDGYITSATDKYRIPRVGVDATHTFEEFKVLFSPSVTKLRGFFKKTPIARYFTS